MKKLFALFLFLAINVQAEGLFDYKAGGADTPISGSASEDAAVKAAPTLEKCSKPFGTIAVAEPQDYVSQALATYKLPPPTGLLRLIIQQSNCFAVVERGIAMQNIMQERALSERGQLKSDSNIGKGQLAVADFLMTPSVTFNESNSGGVGIGALANQLGAAGSIISAIAGGIKFKQAQTTLLLSDARSGIQVASAEGNVEKTDWGIGGVIGGPAGGISAGAYTSSAEGKVIAAALLNNYNNIIQAIKNKPELISANGPIVSKSNAKNSTQASFGFNNGDVIRPKISGINLLAKPAEDAKVITKLNKNDELIYLGEETGGFIKLQGSNASGWADKRLFNK